MLEIRDLRKLEVIRIRIINAKMENMKIENPGAVSNGGQRALPPLVITGQGSN